MHAPSPMALLLIAIVVLVLFGRGKVSSLMGEVGKGITAFKKGVKEGSEDIDAAARSEPKELEQLKTTDDIERARAEIAAERAKLEAERARATADSTLRDVTPTDTTKL
ncbi:twin-arginine translocase TatA/TatE family subunit [Paracoccus sp. PS-1]|uniref:twin-arginine translocase TatA/TatE family subunit n=1 Tax=unclassified Paracoccus (in: a-proteobacteria) TaxID=2688777 RepID=UPI00048D012F|nr:MULTISPECIES: twin-arginine translocase TatA/TatE family subunit [unclassified Paracoccus (in: a-proteobacteria)]MDQ7263797.1 twin-arginine translocase TatA/TatE family subunit [Paracoccus sp. PS1]RQP07494.1 MAG: sec-independent translocation protein MttA [Paracoccus sp. BP8]UFM65224.1 twin-arginine translocase TatA/TatE family subunit [Paracoccus sp. MA]